MEKTRQQNALANFLNLINQEAVFNRLRDAPILLAVLWF